MNSVGILTGRWNRSSHRELDRRRAPRRRRHRLQHRSHAPLSAQPALSRRAYGRDAWPRLPGTLPGSRDDARRVGVKRAPIHHLLAAVVRTSRTSAAGRAPTGTPLRASSPRSSSLSWGRQNWFPYWAAEHQAVREGVGLMDMSFMSKFLVQGRDAGRLLDQVSANDVDGEPESSRTPSGSTTPARSRPTSPSTKLADDRFMVVASDTAHGHVQAWLRRHGPGRLGHGR